MEIPVKYSRHYYFHPIGIRDLIITQSNMLATLQQVNRNFLFLDSLIFVKMFRRYSVSKDIGNPLKFSEALFLTAQRKET